MSNFAFLQTVGWPEMHADCARAESYATSDPRSACFYSRRTVELLIDYLYDVLAVPIPYKNDLAAKINDPAFKSKVGVGIATKLNLIRKLGNTAVHDAQPIPPRVALDALRELHHVMLWAAFRYSTQPQAVPMKAAFEPKLAAKAAPLTRQEVAQLAAKFAAQDEAHAKVLAEKDELAAQKDAEIAALREAVKQAQAANQQTDDRDYNEAETRDRFIDVMLAEAGWPLTDPKDREYPVTGMPNGDGKGFVDYVLWGADGLPLAIVEAKRTTKSPQVGQQQAKLYADCLENMTGRRPVIFYTNGFEHWIWDDTGGYPPREIQGFYNRDELELSIQRRDTRKPLPDMPIDSGIVERHYQHRAIRAIDDAFTAKEREALLVMATGSGKTRTVIALVKQLMEANWVKRVLFLADRTALVTQAANAFKAHLPDATTVNLVTEKITDGRVYVCTYPTMMNLINDTDSGIRKFGPGYFDLVVIDEAHRSVYQKYRAIFDWYDALLVGLTATPKDEVDHNTYRLFHLEDGVPTDAYSLDDAVKEGFLVPAVGISVGTKFLRQGIHYADLSEEEKDDWDALDWGDEDPPDEVSSEEINRFLFNEDTVDKVLAELMSKGHRVAEGDRLGKTIIFAKNQAHAEFIARRFDIQYPQYAGTFARVITHSTAYAQSLIDDFSVTDKAPAHRHIGRHARHRHRRSRRRQPRLLQARPVQDQVLADDRTRDPPTPRPLRPREGQTELLRLRLLRQPRILQPGPARIRRLAPEVLEPAAVRNAPRSHHGHRPRLAALEARTRRGTGHRDRTRIAGRRRVVAPSGRHGDEPGQLPGATPPQAGRAILAMAGLDIADARGRWRCSRTPRRAAISP